MTATLTKCGFPHDTEATAGLTGFANSTLSAQNSGVGVNLTLMLVAANSSETITQVGYRQQTTTGTPAANSYRIGLQGVNSSGVPDGTWLGGGSPAYVDFTPTNADDGKFIFKTLTNSVSINRGQLIALVLTRTAATDASNCISATYQTSRVSGRTGFPTPLTHNGASWSKSNNGYGAMAVASASNYYGYPVNDCVNANSFGSTTEVGIAFTMPTSRCSTYKLLGVRWWGKTGATGAKTFMAALYSGGVTGTVSQIAASEAVDNDTHGTAGSSDRLFEMGFSTGTLPTLDAGTEYVVAFSTTTATEMDLLAITVEDSAFLAALYDNDMGIAFVTRTLTDYPPSGNDSNNFTKTATKRPYVELIFGDLTPPAGGSSSGFIRPVGAGGLVS